MITPGCKDGSLATGFGFKIGSCKLIAAHRQSETIKRREKAKAERASLMSKCFSTCLFVCQALILFEQALEDEMRLAAALVILISLAGTANADQYQLLPLSNWRFGPTTEYAQALVINNSTGAYYDCMGQADLQAPLRVGIVCQRLTLHQGALSPGTAAVNPAVVNPFAYSNEGTHPSFFR